MILKNKKLLIITSLFTLLPIPVGLLLRSRFPAEFTDYLLWTAVLPSLSLLGAQWLCILLSNLDQRNKIGNQKVQALVLWIIPLMSNLLSGILYALLLGYDFSPFSYMTAAFGLLFAAIGNYMPKTRMNATIGIKIPWSYSSEANWNATHRFAGRLWFAGGILMLLGVFLPENVAIVLMTAVLVILCALPCFYSYRFYQRELAEGKCSKAGYSAVDKRILKASGIFLAVILVFSSAVCFVGDLEYLFGADSLHIKADWYSDLTLRYETVEAIEYREEPVPGTRVGGFGSFRLLMGFFSNDEFGTHVRYTYYQPEACIIVSTGQQTLVLSGKTAAETQTLYQTLLERIE